MQQPYELSGFSYQDGKELEQKITISELNPSTPPDPMVIYSKGTFYYFEYTTHWYQARLRSNSSAMGSSLSWYKLEATKYKLVFIEPEDEAREINLPTTENILQNLIEQRKQFQKIQENATKSPSIIPAEPIQTFEPYQGTPITPQHQFICKGILSNAITIPEPRTPEFVSMVNLAIHTPLHVPPSSLENLPEGLEDDFELLRQTLHPVDINHIKLNHNESKQPTIGSIHDFMVYHLLGKNTPSSLDPLIHATRIGTLSLELEVKSMKLPIAYIRWINFITDALALGRFDSARLRYCNLEEINVFLNPSERNWIFSFAVRKFSIDPVYQGLFNPMSNDIEQALKIRKTQIEEYLQSRKVTADTGLIRSLPKSTLLNYSSQLKMDSVDVVAAILSRLPDNEIDIFLAQPETISYFQEFGSQSTERYIEILMQTSEEEWSHFALIPGFDEGLKASIIQENDLESLFDSFTPKSLEMFLAYPAVSSAISELTITAQQLDHLLKDTEKNGILLSSETMIPILFKLFKNREDVLAHFFIMTIESFDPFQIKKILSHPILRTESFQANYFFKVFVHIPPEVGRVFLQYDEAATLICDAIKYPSHISILHALLPTGDLIDLLSSQEWKTRDLDFSPSTYFLFTLRGEHQNELFSLIFKQPIPQEYIDEFNSFSARVASVQSSLETPEEIRDRLNTLKIDELIANDHFFNTAHEFVDPVRFINYLHELPVAFWPKLLNLPYARELLILDQCHSNVLDHSDMYILLSRFSSEKILLLLSLSQITQQLPGFLASNYRSIQAALGAEASQFFDNPIFEADLLAYFEDEVITAFIDHFSNDIPVRDNAFFHAFCTRFMQKYHARIFETPEALSGFLNMIPEGLVISFLTQNTIVLSQYIKFVAEDRASSLFVILSESRGSREDEKVLLEVTKEGYRQQEANLSRITRFTHFIKSASDRPFLALLEERSVRSLNHCVLI